MFEKIYRNLVIEKPKFTLLILITILFSFGNFAKNFQLDASSDTLLLENDPDLKYLREVNAKYSSKDYLVLTYTPKKELLDPDTIKNLSNLKSDLVDLDWVSSVITILDVPLLKNNDDPLSERIKNFKTLSSKDADKERGFKEILNSPIYKEYVISNDGKTSGIIVYIKTDTKMSKLVKTKNDYLNKIDDQTINDEERDEYKNFVKDYDKYKKKYNKKNHQNIKEIRAVIEKYNTTDDAKIHLGGIPMIADDMMTYVKNDIIVFGAGVFLFIVCTLWYVFRNFLWVFIPLLSCFFSVSIMVGVLGLLGWKVTVISSNFIALMLILTMAMNIHISVRYLQFKKDNPNISNNDAILWTSKKMFWPILYTVLTTICAFLSLIFSGIKPIIDFGWMMTLGLLVSLSITFTLLPSILNILSKKNSNYKEESKSIITSFLSKVAQKNTKTIFFSAGLVIVISIIGILKLEVENSFINYFDKKTEIYKGMKLIDEKLGGTTPLEVIIKFQKEKHEPKTEDDDDWGDEEENIDKYWFTKEKIDKINIVHKYLDNVIP